MNVYQQGQSVTIQWVFRDDDATPADPVSQVIRLKAPHGVVTEIPSASVQHKGNGTYAVVVYPDMPGMWVVYVQGSSNDARPTQEHFFEVRGSAFP
jgi:hypothetical protein